MNRFIVIALALVACHHDPPKEPDTVYVEPHDAGPVGMSDASTPCGRACNQLHRLGCPEAEPTLSGVSCLQVCTRAAGLLSVECVSAAQTVDDVHVCNVRCRR